jgi:hypothetical protein
MEAGGLRGWKRVARMEESCEDGSELGWGRQAGGSPEVTRTGQEKRTQEQRGKGATWIVSESWPEIVKG